MTDIRHFLEEAAPQPTARLDAVALVATARRRPWQRWLAWGASLVTLAGVGYGAASLSPASEGGQVLRQLPAPAVTTTSVANDTPPWSAASPASPVAATNLTTRQGGSTADAAPAQPRPGGVLEAAPATTRSSTEIAAADAGTAPAEGCYVHEGERCGYTATKPGGYKGEGPYDMWITRNGQTTHYSGAAEGAPAPANGWCADAGFVRPGDYVLVSAPAVFEQGDTGVRSPFTGDDPGMPPNPPARISVGELSSCASYGSYP